MAQTSSQEIFQKTAWTFFVVVQILLFDPIARGREVPRTYVQGTKKDLQILVDQIAVEVLVDPCLISAVIAQESNWRPSARSEKGAMGLMQLMPETARNWNVKEPFDPRQNIGGGARHLRYLIKLFDKKLSLALAAYHAGEDRILKDRAIPAIPETKKYVSAVLENYDSLVQERLKKGPR